MDVEDLHPWFLGAYAENSNVLRELVDEFVNDHVFIVRNTLMNPWLLFEKNGRNARRR